MKYISIAAFCLLSTIAIGRPSDHTEQVQDRYNWVDKLQNQSGNVCCFDNDGRRLDDPEWKTKNLTYEVFFTEGWLDVPEWAVVSMKNEDGVARVWSVIDENGQRIIRCFLPGSLS